MSLERRHLLLALAREWGSIIIDDDPYGMLRSDGEHIPGFRELGGGDPLVFSVRTFSKILAPGLRFGWVDADPAGTPLQRTGGMDESPGRILPVAHIR